jgi:pilus assembly protein Flp/PilA
MTELVTKQFLAVRNAVSDEQGQGLVEYALIIALVAIALIAGLNTLSGGVTSAFESISDTLSGAGA